MSMPSTPSFTSLTPFAPHITTIDTITNISNQAMHLVWNRSPTDFQKEAIPRLLMMRCAPYTPQALLLIQGTGGGKSAVAQTVGCVDCGVTLIIVETLALAYYWYKIVRLIVVFIHETILYIVFRLY